MNSNDILAFQIWKESHNSLRFIYAFWMLSCLIMSNAYSSIFYSILTVPKYQDSVDSVEDISKIAQSDSRLLFIRDKTSTLNSILKAGRDDEMYHQIRKHFERNKQKMLNIKEEILLVEKSSKNVVLESRSILRIYRRMQAKKALHIGREYLGLDYISMVFPKRSPLLRPFNAM